MSKIDGGITFLPISVKIIVSYLDGIPRRIELMALSFEELTGRTNNHLIEITINNYSVFIHPEIEKDLRDWEKACQQQQIDFAVASAYRSFDRQLLIWNEKAEGKRPVRDKNGHIIDISSLSQQELLDAILLWSHIPGASRHHWGTDLDVFDAKWFKANNEKLELQNSLYENGGPCAKFHELNLKLCSKKFPFYRPYDSSAGNNFFMTELWHYSHTKVSKTYEKHYNFEIFIKNLKSAPNLKLQPLILANSKYYYRNYVTLC